MLTIENNTSVPNHKRPILRWGAAYVAPHIGVTVILVPLNIVVNGIYSEYYGLALTSIAIVMAISRIFDAVSDPIVGYYSDQMRLRTGTRKPMILVGGVLLAACAYFLYLPPTDVNIVYFGVWYITLYLALTLFDLPHTAWGGEMAENTEQKKLVYSLRGLSNYAGHIFFFMIPMLPIFSSEKITPETLKVSVTAAMLLLIPGLFIAYKFAPDGKPSQARFIKKSSFKTEILTVYKDVSCNRPFLIFIAASLILGLSTQMWYSLIFIYVNSYLDMGDQFAKIFLLAFIFGLLATPLWYRLSLLWGKKSVWLLSTGLLIISFIYTGTLKPGETSLTELIFLKILSTFAMSCGFVVRPAMLSDISDYGTWKSGVERNASYFSALTFLIKTEGALGASLGLLIAGWFGFDAAAGSQTESGIFGLTLAIAWLPPVFALIAMVFIALSPICERRHNIIRRRLDSRVLENNDDNKTKIKEETAKENLVESLI